MRPAHDPRTRAQTGWLLGATLIVVLLLIGGGGLVLRAVTAPADATTPATAPTPRPTARTTTAETAEVAGIPWDFPLTRDGALAAAATGLAVTSHPDVVLHPDRFDKVVAVVFAPHTLEKLRRGVDASRLELERSAWGQQPASRRMYHFAPLALRPVAYDPATPEAVVEVWALTLLGVGDAGGAVFTTSTIHLAAPTGSWRIEAIDSVEGPTPLVEAAASPPGKTRALLRDAVPTVPLPVTLP